MSLISSAAALLLGSSLSSLAHAETCAPGDWFCDPASAPEPAPPAPPPPPPPAEPAPELDEERAEPPLLQLDEPELAPHHFGRRHRLRRPNFPRWGAGVHVFGALLGDDSAAGERASMGGLGFALRHFLTPGFALEGDFELGFGTDYSGYDRQESALLLHAIGILNPKSAVRAYLFGGVGFSAASVHIAPNSVTPVTPTYDARYSYVGLDAGAGVEVRLTKHASIHADLLGFLRNRMDNSEHSRPEFIDPKTGRSTNASGGGLLRVGTLFYW
ncbi:MAG: hypothetical protein QM756_41325 [Polyangiaceae bacterium]